MANQVGNLYDTMIRGTCQAAEANLKLQQGLLLGWTRFWPGFTGRMTGSDDRQSYQWLPQQVSDAALQIARTQRDLMDQQFELAMTSLDAIVGAVTPKNGNGSPPAAESPKAAAPEAVKTAPAVPAPATPAPATPAPATPVQEKAELPVGAAKNIYQKVAVVTGAASGIGEAVSHEFAKRGAKTVLLVDRSEGVHELAKSINASIGRTVAVAKVGDATDVAFRKRVFNEAAEHDDLVSIVVPAAGITRDALSVCINKETGCAELYPLETFRQVTDVNLLAPIYWGIEMVARIAEDRNRRGLKRWEPEEEVQGVVVFLGSVSSQGNKGQIAYAVAKAGLEGAAATLAKEAIFHGVRSAIIHPGFTDTPMARALGDDFLNKYVLPYTQLRRLIRPDEIADAICFMVSNSAVSGELWADAGWHPPA